MRRCRTKWNFADAWPRYTAHPEPIIQRNSVAMRNIEVSVILATRNRAETLDRTLASFSALNMAGAEAEFIVVDNGSDDDTSSVLKRWEQRLRLKSLHQPIPGKNRCLNKAVEHARGSLFVFTDDDIIADRNWLFELQSAARRWPSESIFAGGIDPRFPMGTPERVKTLRRYATVLFGAYDPADGESVVAKPPLGGNVAVRSSIFKKYSFDENIGPSCGMYAMGSETELLNRVRRQEGMNFVYVPTARVQHVIRVEQVEDDWMLRRASRAGRGMARAITTVRTRLFRVPWPVWLHLGRACVTKAITSRRDADAKFEACFEFEKLKGCVREFREMATKAVHDNASQRDPRDMSEG